MKNFYLFFVFFVLLFCACNEKNIHNINLGFCDTLFINPDPDKKILYSNMIEHVNYVQLETNENCFLAEITKVIFIEDRFYVLDANSSQVLCFNDKGKFLFKIGGIGKGPGEFVGCDELFYNKKSKSIFINDTRHELKTFIYTLDGKFIKSRRINYFVISTFPVSDKYDGFYLGYRANLKPNQYSFIVTNNNSEKIASYFPIDHYMNNLTFRARVSSYIFKDTATVSHFLQNTIYRLTEKSIIAKYHMNFGKYELNESVLKKIVNYKGPKRNFYKLFKSTNTVYGIDDVLETSGALFFRYRLSDRLYSVFFSKKSKKIYQSVNGIKDNTGSGFIGHPVGIANENFIYALPTLFLHGKQSPYTYYQEGIVTKSKTLKKLQERTKLGDNPILLVTKFKDLL